MLAMNAPSVIVSTCAAPEGKKPTVRWQLGRAVDIGDIGERRQLVDLGVDIHLVSLDERPATGAIPQHGSRSQECIPDVTGVDPLGPDPALNGRKRIGAQHDLGDEPERAE